MKMQESGEEEQTENNTSAGEESSSGDGAVAKPEVVGVPQQDTPIDRPEPERTETTTR
jgi:hypothetical protein